MKSFRTSSSKETKQIGALWARALLRAGRGVRARVLALQGPLGAGKTTFTQGFLRGLGAHTRTTSPTFIIMRRTTLTKKPFNNLFHVDAYRLKKASELKVLDFESTLKNPAHIVVVEWPERVKNRIPKDALWLRFKHGAKPNERTIIANEIKIKRKVSRSKKRTT